MDRNERRRQAVELHQQGFSTQKVADEIGCSWETARRDLEAAGFEFRRTKRASKIEPRVCAREGCEKVFRPSPAQLRKGFGKFCSGPCDHEAHRKYPQPEERVCARDGCETRFTPKGSNVAMGWGKFCSPRCSALSTGAHVRKKGREVVCLECGRTKWRYDSTIGAGFCSHECWGKYRWKHRGETISDNLVSLRSGRARQQWRGRQAGHRGAAGGIEGGREGGRPPKATKAQAAECWRLREEGRSSREIAQAVFGDARLYKRVLRLFA